MSVEGQPGLRIAIPIHSLDPGGVEAVAMNLAEQWRAAGHDVTVVLGRLAARNLTRAPCLDYWRIPNRFASVSWETPWMIYCLVRYLRRNEADILFLAGNTYAIVGAALRVLAFLLPGRRTPPMVLKISNALSRGDMPRPLAKGYRVWLRLHARLFDRLIALSGAMHDEVRDLTGAGAHQVWTIPNPVLLRARIARLGAIVRKPPPATKPGQDRAMHFVSAGRLVAQKNYALLLQAFAAAWRRGDHLTIAGEGPERRRLERLAAELGVASAVSLPGHIGSIDALLAQGDAFVLSSDYEGLPGVVVEALAAGMPVAATDCCASMAGLLDHGRAGLLVPSGDAAALAGAMNNLRRTAVAAPLARRIAAQYEVESAAKRYLDLMNGLKGAAGQTDKTRTHAVQASAMPDTIKTNIPAADAPACEAASHRPAS